MPGDLRFQGDRALPDALFQAGGELLDLAFRLFLFGDVLDQREILSKLITFTRHHGTGHLDPDGRAIGTKVTFLRFVNVNLAGTEPSGTQQVGREILGVGDAHPVAPLQFGEGAAHDGGKAGVGPEDEPRSGTDQENTDRGLIKQEAKSALPPAIRRAIKLEIGVGIGAVIG